jgi:hypothetical protein
MNPPPTKDDLDQAWLVYELECKKLSEMRNPLSRHKQLEIQIQLARTESLLQDWIESSHRFRATLN